MTLIDTAHTLSGQLSKRVSLLILQPTPFCNLDCDYCYLPDRLSTRRMPEATALKAVDRLVEADLAGDSLSIVWHAGEPMTLPASYYEGVFQALRQRFPAIQFRHSFQTNGTLINDAWCEFFLKWNVNLGLSIDGPAFLHDAHRRDRAGKGTHEKVMTGVKCLHSHGVEFHVIAVVTSLSLTHAEQIFDFFAGLGVSNLGFNIEELEGTHQFSSLTAARISQIHAFFEAIAIRQQQSSHRLTIREFNNALSAIACPPGCSLEPGALCNDQGMPLAIVTVAWNGDLSTFSPELIGVKSVEFGDFIFGNVLTGSLATMTASEKFIRLANAIESGRKECLARCEYFPVCGGGAPSNKYFENADFATTETMYCKSVIQIPIQIMLGKMEQELGIAYPIT